MNWWKREVVRQLLALPLALLATVVPGEAVVKSLAAWDIYALCYLFLTWLTYRGHDAESLLDVVRAARRRRASDRWFTATPKQFPQLAAGIALIATLVALPRADELGAAAWLTLSVGVLAVVTAWITLQTGFAMIYLSLYADEGGLDFPGTEDAPEALDFAYFAFSVGTSLGTTDVQVTRRAVRRQVLAHTLLSFVFNTLLLAIAVAVVTSRIADR
ncbi:DUF1345 domain-containing protein [Streptomyces sp. SPB074]|uniref:DUF1345 domain-containing protein n=1 Tax=Streptomyces sp. (strain SPB074) TaxID=465543 RepID=UPI00017F2205|nr:DUF1345 domain-containing protein [Streptomyces sp. SPB074]